jgi:hypothetical protein
MRSSESCRDWRECTTWTTFQPLSRCQAHCLYRYDSPLFLANAEISPPRPSDGRWVSGELSSLVLNVEDFIEVDITGLDALESARTLAARGIAVALGRGTQDRSSTWKRTDLPTQLAASGCTPCPQRSRHIRRGSLARRNDPRMCDHWGVGS